MTGLFIAGSIGSSLGISVYLLRSPDVHTIDYVLEIKMLGR